MKLTENKIIGAGAVFSCLAILAYIAVIAGIGYVAWHFISKLW